MRLAKIENGVVVNVARFDPDHVPEWAEDWVLCDQASKGDTFKDGQFIQRGLSDREKKGLAQSILAVRDQRLAETGEFVLQELEQGRPVSQDVISYREKLRGIQQQSGFPEVVEWPVKPGLLDQTPDNEV